MRIPATIIALLAFCGARSLHAQIRVNPTGVNVNAQGATTVFLTFGGLAGYAPAESFWCGELIPAAPAIGNQCDPATLFGALPARYDLSRTSGSNGYTDIMSIPPSVAVRAYQAAAAGATSSFFYVRRFQSLTGGPDQFVTVTCRLAGGGARVPFALTNVVVAFDVDTPVLFVESGAELPRVSAEISFNGTGVLRGRWEVALPGEEGPDQFDLVTEGTLPAELRGTQRRFTEIERFNVFLPPTGRFTLEGPDPSRIPTSLDGAYLLLLRIEASDDKEGDSDLAAAGAGTGVVHSGAVAGFSMPTLRYFVGDGGSELASSRSPGAVRLTGPIEGAELSPGAALTFTWAPDRRAALYRLEIEAASGDILVDALLPPGTPSYEAPVWLSQRAASQPIRWRVSIIDTSGSRIARSDWWSVHWQEGQTGS